MIANIIAGLCIFLGIFGLPLLAYAIVRWNDFWDERAERNSQQR